MVPENKAGQKYVHVSNGQLIGSFAHALIRQGRQILEPASELIAPAILAFDKHIREMVIGRQGVTTFDDNKVGAVSFIWKATFKDLKEVINEEEFRQIPEIIIWNEHCRDKYGDFIDIYALARNIINGIILEESSLIEVGDNGE